MSGRRLYYLEAARLEVADGGASVTKLLDEAFEEASQLPDDEQNSFAEWLLGEPRSEQRWSESFSRSSDELARLAKKALRDYAAGETSDLDKVAS